MDTPPLYVRPLGYMIPEVNQTEPRREEFVWPDDEPFNPECDDNDATQGE